MREISDELGTAVQRFGQYEALRLLGTGGMGRVFRGIDSADGSRVAIKVMSPELVDNPVSLARFHQETEILRSIQHPNVASILDQGVDDSGLPYLVLEFIEGPSLGDMIRSRTNMPYSRIAGLMVQAAQGLEAAYKHKIIHRDIKPANLMLHSDGTLKIVDFGLAKHLFNDQIKARKDAIAGTPRYMAPEQVCGGTVDHRTDMYALGASFYQLITGQPPYDAPTPQELMQKHVQDPLVPLYVINPEVPADLSDTVQRLMAKDPNDRYQDYDELIAALREVEMARLAKENSRQQRPVVSLAELTRPTHNVLSVDASAPADARIITAEEPEKKSPFSLFIMPVVVVLLIASITGGATFLLKEVPDEKGQTRSEWSVIVSKLFKDAHAPGAEKKAVDTMLENIDKMNLMRAACTDYLLEKKEFPKSAKRLLDAGMLLSAKDAYGNDMAIYPIKRIIVSFGEDGIEGSSDDFVMDSQGNMVKKPFALTEYQARAAD